MTSAAEAPPAVDLAAASLAICDATSLAASSAARRTCCSRASGSSAVTIAPASALRRHGVAAESDSRYSSHCAVKRAKASRRVVASRSTVARWLELHS